MIGKVVAERYRIVRLLGAGGMGSVYEGVDAVTGARVAVKLITAETAKNPTLMGRFEREARAATSIETPHIIKMLDAGNDAASGLPFLVLEFLEGEDVQHVIKRLGPLSPDLALRMVAQACLGLDRAHEARIIHRDIKPANFFLAKGSGGQRIVKLLDFGIAKIAHDPSESKAETAGLTRTGSMLGSPLYMSPEQARGLKEIDRRSDLWSMGVVLYQALTGRTPHQDTDALGELIIAICTEEPPAIQELAPWVPPHIAAIAHKAMRFSPDERYQSAADMLDDIRPLLSEGWSIDEEMFRPLTDQERGHVAPRLTTAPDAPVGRSGRTHAGRTGHDGAASGPNPQRPAGATHDSMASTAPTGSLQGLGTTVGSGAAAPPPASGSRTAVVVAGGLVATALGAFLAYQVTRPPPAPLPAVTTVVTTTAAAPTPRTVKLVVLPADASVEVDGVKAGIIDGAVELSGALGSVHKVHLSTADGEITKDVVVSESGAVPTKVEAPPPPPKSTASTRPAVVPVGPTGKTPPKPPGGPPDLRPR